MNILWITNIPVGKHILITRTSHFVNGWITAALEMLIGNKSLRLCIATTWSLSETKIINESNVEYVVLPGGYPSKYDYRKKKNRQEWRQLVMRFKPDVIHIHGTEFSHGLALMTACPNEKYIISIQGLCGIIERYFYAGIDISLILKNATFRDVFRWDSIVQARRKFQNRGYLEREYIRRTKHVIGRTRWDFVHSKLINKKINYHFCNESLRSEFYNKKWNIKRMKRNSIFISQASYPIKGLHILLKAVNILKMEYDDVHLYIAGKDIIELGGFVTKVKQSGYARYLRNLIKKYSLQKYISFTGALDAEKMSLYYQNSHVFVCPSSIENSPNSVGEAQLIGIPCIASYVGGIPDMIKDEESGLLYRFEEYEMLAYNIKRIFEDDKLAIKLSTNGRNKALRRHSREINTMRTLEIYNEIANG